MSPSSRRRRRGGAAGAALAELLIVAALLGLLATLSVLTLGSVLRRTQAHTAAANMVLIRDGMLRVASDCGGLPVWTGGGDPGLVTRASWGTACWRGPYLSAWPVTGGTYEFSGPGQGVTAVVRVTGLSQDATAAVAADVAGVFGSGAGLSYGTASGWSAEIPVGTEYLGRATR